MEKIQEVLGLTIFFFFFNDTATTEIYTLSLHDALPISINEARIRIYGLVTLSNGVIVRVTSDMIRNLINSRSEEHTSELQSQSNLVCRLLLEKKKKNESRMASRRAAYLHDES